MLQQQRRRALAILGDVSTLLFLRRLQPHIILVKAGS
jgi:hypothetical protein